MIKEFNSGDILTAEDMNDIVDAVSAVEDKTNKVDVESSHYNIDFNSNAYLHLTTSTSGLQGKNSVYLRKSSGEGISVDKYGKVTLKTASGEYDVDTLAGDVSNLKTYVTPEMYGAKGDGVTDDTQALASAFNSGESVYIPNKTYRFSLLTVQNNNNLIINCDGVLKHLDFTDNTYTELIKFISCNSLKIKGLTIDGNSRASRCVILKHCENALLEDVTIKNVGTKDICDNHVFGLGIWDASHNCKIVRTTISKVYSNSNTSGIFIYDNETSSGELLPINCNILEGLIEDIYPITDGDGLKILNKSNTNDANLNVTNCKFIDCRKRALKFQARGCHSVGNTMIWNEMGIVPIDMQRGYCTSTNDIVISNYNHGEEKDHTHGFFEYLVGMEGCNNKVSNIGYFVNHDCMWMVDSTYDGFVGYGALVNLGCLDDVFKKDDSGEYIIEDGRYVVNDDATASGNVLDGVYGNGVVKALVSISFLCEENLPDNLDPINGVRFKVYDNYITNSTIVLTGKEMIVNQNTFAYNCYADYRYNHMEKLTLYSYSDIQSSRLYLPSVYYTGEVRALYNYFDLLCFPAGNGDRFSFGDHMVQEFAHSNSLKFEGSYRRFQNITSELMFSGNSHEEIKTRLIYYSPINPQNDTEEWRKDFLMSADVGDVCINTDTLQVTDGKILTRWVCVETPSEEHTYGKWEEYYEEDAEKIVDSKINTLFSYDDATNTLYINITED